MSSTTEQILLFKTNIKEQDLAVQSFLNNMLGIRRWVLDCEDEDCVLKIVAQNYIDSHHIISGIHHLGHSCEEF